METQKAGEEDDLDSKLSAMRELIMSHLGESDKAFKEILKKRSANEEVLAAVDEFKELLENASGEVDDAETMEWADFASSNKGITLLSFIENSEAQEAIEALVEGQEELQKAVERYKEAVGAGGKAPALDIPNIDDTFDLILDLCLDGFDFMSIFTLSELDNAQEKLEELGEKIDQAHELFLSHQTGIEECITKCCARVEAACV